jgi:hypothetical protein
VLGLEARLGDPRGIAVSRDGEVYFADAADHVVRRLIPNVPASMTIFEGNGQTVTANRYTTPLRVRITGRTGRPVPGVTVVVAIIFGGVTTQAGMVDTNADGIAQFSPSLGTRTGPITIRASATGLPPVEFQITAQ